jgi:exonuclease III
LVRINNNPVVLTFNCNSWQQRWPELHLQLQQKEINILLLQEVCTAKNKIYQLYFHQQLLSKLGYATYFSLEDKSHGGVAIIIRKCYKHTISLISTRIISYETKDFAFINTYEYSNFESHKTEVAEHFRLLEEETICLSAINKQIIVGGDFNSPPNSYNGTWSRNRTRNICTYLQDYISTFNTKIIKTKEFTFPSDQSNRDCNNSHLDYFLSINLDIYTPYIFHDLQSDHFAVAFKLNLNISILEPSFIYSKRIINSEKMTDSKWLEFKNSNICYSNLLIDDTYADMDNFIKNLKEILEKSII